MYASVRFDSVYTIRLLLLLKYFFLAFSKLFSRSIIRRHFIIINIIRQTFFLIVINKIFSFYPFLFIFALFQKCLRIILFLCFDKQNLTLLLINNCMVLFLLAFCCPVNLYSHYHHIFLFLFLYIYHNHHKQVYYQILFSITFHLFSIFDCTFLTIAYHCLTIANLKGHLYYPQIF